MKKVLFAILILKSFLIADVSVKYLKTENPTGIRGARGSQEGSQEGSSRGVRR